MMNEFHIMAILSDGTTINGDNMRNVWKVMRAFFRGAGLQAIYYAVIRVDCSDRYFVWNTPDGLLSVPIIE